MTEGDGVRNLPVALLLGVLIGSPALAKDCETIDGNQVDSCGFESPAEVAAWSPSGGTLVFAAGAGETGNGAVGSAENFSGTWVFNAWSPCFPAVPGQEFDLGFSVKLLNGSVPDRCSAGWLQFADMACSVQNGFTSKAGDEVIPGGAYSEVTGSHVVTEGQLGTLAMSLFIDCRGAAGAFEVLVDNGYAKVSIFADGFETGDASRWSNTVP
jgi:hypothetical protein